MIRHWPYILGRPLQLGFPRAVFAFVLSLLIGEFVFAESVERCPKAEVVLQVLGAGGPEVEDLHASSGYLIWIDGRARVLVDLGGGVPLRFAAAGAEFTDLDVILFTHLHADHSAGLPVLVKSSFLSDRQRDLPVFGPAGNDFLPSVSTFVERLFAKPHGVYPYLHEYIEPGRGAYTLRPIVVQPARDAAWQSNHLSRFKLKAAKVHHGPLPALAWRIEVGARSVTISGDTSAQSDSLSRLAADSDIFVAHNAVPEGASGVARKLHMTPSRIGEIAAKAKVKHLVLSHRMRRTFGREDSTRLAIRKSFGGSVTFADDLSCYPID